MKLNNHKFINASEKDSFAYFTIAKRFPKILNDIIATNDFNEEIKNSLSDLASKILKHKIEKINNVFEINIWRDFFNIYEGKLITDIPFFFAEIYFYELILSLSNYSVNKKDPFREIKSHEISNSLDSYNEAIEKFNSTNLGEAILFSLSGNKADLSQISNNSKSVELLINQTNELERAIINTSIIHIILDNSGTELFSDIYLTKKILSLFPEKKIKLYPKAKPLLVSDATKDDIIILLESLNKDFTKDFSYYLKSQSIQIVLSDFWNLPLHFTSFEQNSNLKINYSDLIISKGDANYRRFYEDRQIPVDFTGAAKICSKQFALRTLKSEILAGFSKEKASKLNSLHPNWMVNGEYGVIQNLL